MDPELREWIERRFRIPEARASKLTTLPDAIERHVRPGDAIHLGVTHARGTAAAWELLRRYVGTEPAFELQSVAMSSPMSPLVHAGLARKIVTSWAGDSYWTPGPNGAYQRAWKDGVEFEHWSILTFSQRLAAGARGLPWTATRSLRGSTMAVENDVRALDDESILIPALVPDVSIFHAPAADETGNVLFAPPLMENVWGGLAARRGTIVTADRIVDQDFVRRHAHMTRLPSSAVLAVVEVPYGAHPGGIVPAGIEGALSYGEDYEFWVDIRNAARDPAAFDAWIKEWVIEPETHERYLGRLGKERITALERRVRPESWREDLEAALPEVELDAEPNAIETAICVAGRELRARIRENGYTAMLAGAGMANLAAWIAAYDLADDGVAVDLVAEMGLVGYWPRPGEPIIFNQRNFPTCTMLTDIEGTLSVLIGGGRARSIGALGAAQVDKLGNVNSTLVPGEFLLMGSGGANDVATCATESLVIATHTAERMLDRVPYVTSPGEWIRTLVTTLGIMRKDEHGELVLTEVFDDDPESGARECRARCGWDLRVARDLGTVPPPTGQELRTLRIMDPRGFFRA